MSEQAATLTPEPLPAAELADLHPPARRRRHRRLGELAGDRPGPTLVVVGGVHGNEPSGVLALERVFASLAGRSAVLTGEIVALAGNLEALERGVRYVDRDLNRCWTPERVERLAANAGSLDAEDREQAALLAEMRAVFARARGPVFILDLHSTSGGGAPFAVLNDTLPNRAFASRLPVPIVLGLEEQLGGTLLAYFSDLGHVVAAFEAGQHDDSRSVDNAEAAIWLAMAAAGVLDSSQLAPPAHLAELLRRAGAGLPRFVEARHRHGLEPGDGFQMEPGFENFQPVEEGRLLARDREGEIRAPMGSLLLMPLYQPQGDDGFFLVRGFSPVWLELSAWLRRRGADRIVHWLPGVRRHPELPDTYLVNRRVARWFAMDVFHLLGFRRREEAGDRLMISRRSHDLDSLAPR